MSQDMVEGVRAGGRGASPVAELPTIPFLRIVPPAPAGPASRAGHEVDEAVTLGGGAVRMPRRRPADLVRRTVDVVLCALAIAVLAAPMLLIALAVRLEDRGPALFRQERVGLGGRRFTLLKFRTMTQGGSDAQLRDLIARELRGEDTVENGSSKLNNDRRVTRVGAFLRRTSLDELPQLINVLRGEMTLVGPRPCLDWEAEMFPARFRPRFSVVPGLTGLWQVSGRSALGTLDMLELDMVYVRDRTLWSDLGILLRTVPSLLGSGAR
jgi:lipopolysaccharide/colanic/teichoic acid biosynthesis glycosyltransferase